MIDSMVNLNYGRLIEDKRMKKTSTYKKGNLAKYKVKNWLVEQGYFCEYSEIYRTHGKFHFKHDIFGADIMATRLEPIPEFILVNVVRGRKNIAAHKESMLCYPIPSFIKQWIAVVEPRKKIEIIDLKGGK